MSEYLITRERQMATDRRVAELEGALREARDRMSVPCPGCNKRAEIHHEGDDFIRAQMTARCSGCGMVGKLTWGRDARVAELEGALDETLTEVRELRAWRERAWDAMREMGEDARGLFGRLFPEKGGRGG